MSAPVSRAASEEPPGVLRRMAAGSVHALTASGGAVGLLALLATSRGDFSAAALWMLVALAIDGVDGTLARRLGVAELTPGIDGRRLDDIIDYLNYVVVPAFFLVEAGCVDHAGWAALPVLASAYGFARSDAKTADHFFLGFPSYWNVFAIYAWQLDVSPIATQAWIAGLALAVFVPLKFVNPSRMTSFGWLTNGGAAAWTLLLAAAIGAPRLFGSAPVVWISLLYPVWYVGISLWLGGLRRAQP